VKDQPLEGLRIVVCRPPDQAAPLAERLTAESADVVFAPVIAVTDPADGGAELRGALVSLMAGDWLVLTSPNGAARAGAALDGELADGVKVAVVGPGTAERARAADLPVDLVPDRSVAEGLLEMFPAPSSSGGSIVLARAAVARDVLPTGLREMGWDVTDVAAYRTVTADLSAEQRRAAASSEVVIFTSSSTVDRLVAELGPEAIPPVVVSIGPATSATAADHGLDVTVEASVHSVPGLVDALVEHARSWGRDDPRS
jgi:uroporphyrinogen III methyltransferase/synthase